MSGTLKSDIESNDILCRVGITGETRRKVWKMLDDRTDQDKTLSSITIDRMLVHSVS